MLGHPSHSPQQIDAILTATAPHRMHNSLSVRCSPAPVLRNAARSGGATCTSSRYRLAIAMYHRMSRSSCSERPHTAEGRGFAAMGFACG